MKDGDLGCWMKNCFVARAFIMKHALGCGLKQNANKVFSFFLLLHRMTSLLRQNVEKLSCDRLPFTSFKSNISEFFNVQYYNGWTLNFHTDAYYLYHAPPPILPKVKKISTTQP